MEARTFAKESGEGQTSAGGISPFRDRYVMTQVVPSTDRYLTDFRALDERVEQPDWLRALRRQAFERFQETGFPTARRLAREVLSLPVHPLLSDDDLKQIVEGVNAWTESRRPEQLKEAPAKP